MDTTSNLGSYFALDQPRNGREAREGWQITSFPEPAPPVRVPGSSVLCVGM